MAEKGKEPEKRGTDREPKPVGKDATQAQRQDAPRQKVPESLWDKSYLAEYVEGFWDNPSETALRQAMADWIGEGDGTLLDVGCGSARVAPMLKGWDYHGVDGSEKLLAYAANRVKPSKLVVSDITKELPFDDSGFDVVICMNVLRHLDSYEGVLAEMVRVAKGAVYVVDMWGGGQEHLYQMTEMAGVVFPSNTWSLPVLIGDAVKLGCRAERHEFKGLVWEVTGVRLEVP